MNPRFLPACGMLLLGLTAVWQLAGASAQDNANEALIEMIGDLVRDTDRDMRALGLQQIREEVPGAAATKRFVELLPALSPEGQAALLDALGDRGDTTARPAVLQSLASDQTAVRVAALAALGGLGGAADVPLLAEQAAAGAPAEQVAAATSLVRLRGEKIHAAILAASESAEPAVRAQLLSALGHRHAIEALPAVLAGARDTEPVVQSAALRALRLLAAPKDTADLVRILNDAGSDAARHQAQLVLLTVCSRGGEACVPALRDGLADADEGGRIVLLHALARAGGPAALEAVIARLEDDAPTVRDEALRILSRWPDPALESRLLDIAAGSDDLRHQVLAIRGLVRLADADADRPADAVRLARVLQLARRPAEKRLVLGALSRAAEPAALATALPLLTDNLLGDEAALAIVGIAQRLDDPATARDALQRVLETSQHSWARERALEILEAR